MKKGNNFMKRVYQKIIFLFRKKMNNKLYNENISSAQGDDKKNEIRRPEAAREL